MKEVDDLKPWRRRIYDVVHDTSTKKGKVFNLALFGLIIISVIYVLLESVDDIDETYHPYMVAAEWIITILFTIEYVLKTISLKRPKKYVLSFYGIIDLLSTLLRVFRILKLVKYMGEANVLSKALIASRLKIGIFIYIVLIMCVIMGSVMYIVEEGANSGFSSIPKSIYWTIVTITTVGYGDIAPSTNLGQAIASFIMILGYGIIAIPTGIVTSEMTKNKSQENTFKPYVCHKCGATAHPVGAKYCHGCREELLT